MNRTSDLRSVWVLGLALVALFLKLTIAYNTIGTNDAVIFYGFAKVLSEHSLAWTYQHSSYFNHPPLTAYYLRGIYFLTEQNWCQQLGIHFPFLLRFPGILADFIVVLLLLQMAKPQCRLRIPGWALGLFAVSPVSLMVSGFHGNTDSVMVLFLVCAAFMALRNRAALCGLFLALSCQIKVVPLLFLPALVLFWMSRRSAWPFCLSFAFVAAILWSEPLLNFPLLFAKNVLSYGGYWGVWGISYLLRVTGLHEFSKVAFSNLDLAQNIVILTLKLLIITAACLIAWRRHRLGSHALMNSLAYTWLVFFVFAPGVCAQYLIWLAPFVLILSPAFYGCLLLASSIFLFRFYDVTAGGLPWSVAVSTDELREFWAPWSLLPWSVLIVGSIALWRKTAAAKPALDLVSSETLLGEIA